MKNYRVFKTKINNEFELNISSNMDINNYRLCKEGLFIETNLGLK